jgi:hypothetical protein
VIISRRTSIKAPLTRSTSEFYAIRQEPTQRIKDLFIRVMGSRLITRHLYQREVPTPRRTYESWRMALMNPSSGIPKVVWFHKLQGEKGVEANDLNR